MKRCLLILVLAGAALAGCARYDMLLTNGMRVTNVTRPKFDSTNGVYTYKDVKGTERMISAGRVVQILPHSSKNSSEFNPP